MKVLVPLDGSVLAECMLTPARRLAPAGDVILVRVVPGAPREHEKRQLQAAEAYLEQQRRALEAQGVGVRWCLEEGDPAERILAIARERAPDVIAMATHGETGRVGSARGSVAERVLRSSKGTPLLLANPSAVPATGEGLFGQVLVPLDGSEVSAAVLDHVAPLAAAFGSEVVLLTVAPDAADYDPEAVTAGLATALERLRAAGVAAKAWAAAGDEVEEILRAAGEVDLVAMATHGRSGVSRWWFGSVAEQVVRACPKPLLVVRPTEA